MGKERGVKRVLVEVVSENVTIINFLRKRGFRFRRDPDGLIFLGEKQL
jgi:ribosomal protein S18 acetylase RimI-like enzyme